ncbi:MAG: DNA recombination protein RmuC [Actinomycetes bacterium]|jgi:DNA recombination protein RmuC
MSNLSLVISALVGLVGLVVGGALATLYARARSSKLNSEISAEIAKNKVLTDQLDALRKEESEKVRLDQSLQAVTQTINILSKQSQEAELKRVEAESVMRTQIENMRTGNETLLRETTRLAGALSNSQTRGKFGETQLEMILENSGLIEGVHFFKQDYRSKDAAISKPDIRIAIPGGSEIFIDSKFPFDRFLEAIGESDPTTRRSLMELHAKDLMGHVNALAKRGYQESSNSPDYVVLFAPFESILSEALEVDPQILHKSFEKGITIATPTTMMALLRTVAYVFNQSEMAHNATAITDLAGLLLKRIGVVHNKIAALGKSIKTSERAFNDLVQSAEENMLRPARKMLSLGVPSSNKLKSNEHLDDELREIKPKLAIVNGELFDDEDIDLDETDGELE